MVGPGRHERSWIRGAQAGSASDLEALFSEHWPRAHRARVSRRARRRRRPRTSHRRRSSRQSAISIVSTAGDRSARGSIASSSTGRSTWARARTLRRETAAQVEAGDEYDTGDLGTFSEGVAAGLASLQPEHRAVMVLRYLSTTRPARSPSSSTFPVGPSTRASGGASTASRRSSTGSTRERRHRSTARAPAHPGAGRARRPAAGLAARASCPGRARADRLAPAKPSPAPGGGRRRSHPRRSRLASGPRARRLRPGRGRHQRAGEGSARSDLAAGAGPAPGQRDDRAVARSPRRLDPSVRALVGGVLVAAGEVRRRHPESPRGRDRSQCAGPDPLGVSRSGAVHAARWSRTDSVSRT